MHVFAVAVRNVVQPLVRLSCSAMTGLELVTTYVAG